MPLYAELLQGIPHSVLVSLAARSEKTMVRKAEAMSCVTKLHRIVPFTQGWLSAKKRNSETWKKRWAVLRGSKLILYSSNLCLELKDEIRLSDNVHIEVSDCLVNLDYHKHVLAFLASVRIVNKNFQRERYTNSSRFKSVQNCVACQRFSSVLLDRYLI